MTWIVSSFYRFEPLDSPETVAAELHQLAEAANLHGLVILAHEGFNAALAAPSEEALEKAKSFFRALGRTNDLDEKDARAETPAFRNFQVKIRPEIVSLGRPDLRPSGRKNKLSAAAWDQAIRDGAYILDTRNAYESRIGSFRGAVKPDIRQFSDFPEVVKQNPPPKDRPILIFCTGGIRCEKAIHALEEQGYENVHQLDGGILRYLETSSAENWEGECFVFDHRVAVTKTLEPTRTYAFCPLCGFAAEKQIHCRNCGKEACLCPDCEPQSVCSKNCRYHAQRKQDSGPRA